MSPLLFELFRWWFAIRYEAVQRDKRGGDPNSVCVLFFVKKKRKRKDVRCSISTCPRCYEREREGGKRERGRKERERERERGKRERERERERDTVYAREKLHHVAKFRGNADSHASPVFCHLDLNII
jgi:hypothetical protein